MTKGAAALGGGGDTTAPTFEITWVLPIPGSVVMTDPSPAREALNVCVFVLM
jgi:hypothetical protein